MIEVLDKPEAQQTEELLELDGVRISRAEIGDVYLFLGTDRGKAWLEGLCSNVYYTKWYDHQRGPHEMKWCNELAEKILEAKATATCIGEIHDVVEEQFSGGQEAEDVYIEEHEEAIVSKIEAMASDLRDLQDEDPTLPDLDEEEWAEALKDRIVEHMYDQDDSTVLDMLDSYDRCEIVVQLGEGDGIYSNKAWADLAHLQINDSLQSALAAMGYTIEDYRRMSGNRSRATDTLRRVRKRAQPLLTEDELRLLVSEASSTYLTFVLYAMVPVRDLIDLDLSKPFSLSRYSIASYDPMNGCFFSIERKEAVTIMPGDGKLGAPSGYSPDSICGFVHSYFHADIANVG